MLLEVNNVGEMQCCFVMLFCVATALAVLELMKNKISPFTYVSKPLSIKDVINDQYFVAYWPSDSSAEVHNWSCFLAPGFVNYSEAMTE